jgi:hypothetical protein
MIKPNSQTNTLLNDKEKSQLKKKLNQPGSPVKLVI